MPANPAITFDSTALLAAALLMAGAAVVVALARRAMLQPLLATVAVGLGLIVLAVATGGPRVTSDAPQRIAVMVDTSESTVGATYRDPEALRARITELLGDRPYVDVRLGTSDGRTTWTAPPPDAGAVLLLSDGRFEPPATVPPVYAVIDPALEQPADASVTAMQRRGERIIVTTSNSGPPRELTLTGVKPATRPIVPAGTQTISLAADPKAPVATAMLAAGDAWPQNDALAILAPPPVDHERWWVGDGGAPGAGWRAMSTAELPSDPVAYLAPSIIALDNVAASSISAAQAQRLRQYVRDLGGGLLVLGGDRAFAAGGYDGSILGDLSPLASSPPQPAARWTFLIDASGSMAGQVDGGRTRFAAAVAAAREAVAQLPSSDLLSVGGFSDQLRWWLRDKPVKEAASALRDVPPPRGPTNLEAALRALASSLDKGMANHVVLLTDGQVELRAGDELAQSLTDAGARLHVLAIGAGPGLPALRKLAGATGGGVAEEADAAQWAAGLVKLLRQASPRYWMTTPIEVRFGEGALPPVSASSWNRTWLKRDAEALARTSGDDVVPMAARMNVGSGQVAAVAFRPPDGHVEVLAAGVQSPPRDTRLKVAWRSDRALSVDIDAGTLNGLAPSLTITPLGGPGRTYPVPQTGPGRYVLSLPAPRETAYATLSEGGRIIDRFAVPGRYEAEFDGIGNDRAALAALAQRTGGRVIEPAERGPLQLAAARAGKSIAPHLAIAGALLVSLGLVAWRRRSV